jgi:ParB-like chromosome segregation protein Spo0J
LSDNDGGMRVTKNDHELIEILTARISSLPLDEMVDTLNEVRERLHAISPFKNEPVDFVKWTRADEVQANDYNPNSVAPPEMELLRVSILADGYTQPIVANKEGEGYVVVDGFHRNRVGKECADVNDRIMGYLPIVQIRQTQIDKSERMASTIRHNRARGKHRVEAMSDIVVELKRRNWSNERIAKNLGMDADEVLRLCQITGLAELFSDQQFSEAWNVEGEITESDFSELTDDIETYGDETQEFRTVNTSDETRIFHTYDKWECHAAGFYKARPPAGMKKDDCLKAYAEFLSDNGRFRVGLERVISEWKHSCEHYLTNTSMNRIAWLGQAAMCVETGVPSEFRSGYTLLSPIEQRIADELALEHLNKWLTASGRPAVSFDEAYSGERQADIY